MEFFVVAVGYIRRLTLIKLKVYIEVTLLLSSLINTLYVGLNTK